jgi:hypothetical protein
MNKLELKDINGNLIFSIEKAVDKEYDYDIYIDHVFRDCIVDVDGRHVEHSEISNVCYPEDQFLS